MGLQPEEPSFAPDGRAPLRDFVALVTDAVEPVGGRPVVIAVDGRSGAGKSTLAGRMAEELRACVIGTDDLAWNEPLYEWGHLLHRVIAGFRDEGAVDFRPPAWARHGREGAIVVPAVCRVLLIEGTGASQRAVSDLIDASVWVQTDDDVAEARGVARDISDGTNGPEAESIAFWHWWQAAERPFFAADRPWERAEWIVLGGVRTSPLDDVVYAARPRHEDVTRGR